MYGRRTSPTTSIILAFLAGWVFAQVFNVTPKNSVPFINPSPTKNK